MNLIDLWKTWPRAKVYRHYCSLLQRPWLDFQVDDWLWVDDQQDCCVCRSRGGSKTFDFVSWLVLHVLLTHERWVWLACKSNQLSQARYYLKQNPFVVGIRRETAAKYEITLLDGQTLVFGIISDSMLGYRCDGILYDEFEALTPHQEAEVYPQMAGMMSVSKVHKQVYLGTLWMQTLFLDYTTQLPTRIRAWDSIPFIVTAGMVQAEIAAGITPEWQIDLLYRCIPTAPNGLLFPNVELGEYGGKLTAQYGMDFGTFDTCVGCVIDHNICYVVEEYQYQIETNLGAYDFLKGRPLEVESGGYNDSDRYSAKCQQMKVRLQCRSMPVTNDWKNKRQLKGRSFYKIVVSSRCPHTYKDLKGTSFGPDGLYLKDTSHPCHYLDAWLHSLEVGSQLMTIGDAKLYKAGEALHSYVYH